MKKLLVVFIALLTAFTVGCHKQKSQMDADYETMTVKHLSGESEVKKNPERVVLLDLSSADTLAQLGLQDKVVGIAKNSLPEFLNLYQDSKYADLGTLMDYDFEKIYSLSPDLIIITGRQSRNYDELAEIAPTINLNIDSTRYLDSFKENVKLLASLWGEEANGEELIRTVEKEAEEVRKLAEADDKRALIVMYNAGKFSAYGAGSRFGMIHDILGVKEAQDEIDVTPHGRSISSEFISKLNPDYLFIVDRNVIVTRSASARDEIENKLIQTTNAYQNGKVIYLPPEYWYLADGGAYAMLNMIRDVKNGLYD